MKKDCQTISLGFTPQEFPAGVHVCQIVSEDEEREQALLQFLLSGLCAGERTSCFSEHAPRDRVAEFFRGQGISYDTVSRQQVESAPIDMTVLAQAVFGECAAQAPGRQLQFTLQQLPTAQGDRAMLRQVLTNLCSNAIKYTRTRAVAEIEIGGRPEGAENLYYVKDNGVGFDLKYANKLFGVFQRLPNAEGFEGTGVGLALVQRVIHRHGGRVWAEAKLNAGATFYFTLPTRRDET